jgi:DNA-binding response OmpR family regulator
MSDERRTSSEVLWVPGNHQNLSWNLAHLLLFVSDVYSLWARSVVASSQRGYGMKLLIIDSDRDMVEMLMNWLRACGYEVYRAYTGEQAKSKWLDEEPDLVILDVALKDVNALDMCRDLRTKHDALVLVVTDGKDVQDEVRCLESGADDYLRKPFFPNQLLARIRAVSRRARSSISQRPSSIITVGPIVVDSLHNEVKIHGRTVRLTPTEGKLMHLLAANANDVCTAEQIVTRIWGFGEVGDTYLIKAHIHHLRQKIEPNLDKPYYILTVPGVGYTLVRRLVDEDVDTATDIPRKPRLISG